jgi:hypothetical protein
LFSSQGLHFEWVELEEVVNARVHLYWLDHLVVMLEKLTLLLLT